VGFSVEPDDEDVLDGQGVAVLELAVRVELRKRGKGQTRSASGRDEDK